MHRAKVVIFAIVFCNGGEEVEEKSVRIIGI